MTTPARPVVVHPSVHAPGDGIWFVTPPGFVDVPLVGLVAPQGSTEARVADEALAPLLASAADEMARRRVLGQLDLGRRMFQELAKGGTVHSSLGLHRDDRGGGDGGTLLSLFTLTWIRASWAPRGLTAARAVVTAEGYSNVEYEELACGPATFSEMVRTPTDESRLPRKSLLQIQAHLPHPDGTPLALLTLSTTAVAHREQYRAVLRRITETVSFDDPFKSDEATQKRHSSS
ncbi:hypothetical protein [Streptomyces sp. 142MFCol3.1]|uniref:hypothetical protein n=1 Tax=Streptomyces sp. 142MFCol3.1 TaxID=1172179 RepID=UPI0007C529B9|nr:hypothetical protein [Streptomyces sp. 142MFCol3.1]